MLWKSLERATVIFPIFITVVLDLIGIQAIRVNESSIRVNSDSQEQIILQQVLRDYDQRVRPPPTNLSELYGPVHVKVNMLIRMLSKIDVVNMEYSMQITFREQWMDRRLAYDHLNLPNTPKFLTVPHIKNNVWMPDTFFPTEKAAHRHLIDTENMFLRIYPDGKILYSVRLSMTCSCPMYLQLYPMDAQNCDFDLISYAHTDQDIIYSWDDAITERGIPEPVQKKTGVGSDLPNFWLEKIETHHDCISRTNTGTYDCLRMRMKLKRLFSYYVSQIYGPTMMIVVVSWVSFWIDMHSTAGRVALGVTTLLTMTTLQSSINAKLPPVSYVKAIDVWLGACQTFVFGALIEYAVVSYSDNSLRSTRNKEKPPKENFRKAQRRGVFVEEETPFYQPPCTCGLAIIGAEPLKISILDKLQTLFKKPSYLPAKIDFYARFITPVGFILFNIIYWTSCAILVAKSAEELK